MWLSTGNSSRRVRRYWDLILHVRRSGFRRTRQSPSTGGDGRHGNRRRRDMIPPPRPINPPVVLVRRVSGPLREPDPIFRLAIGSRTPGVNPETSLPRQWRTRGKIVRTSGKSQCLYFGNRGTPARQASDRNPLREMALRRKKPRLVASALFVNPWVAFYFATGVEVERAGSEPEALRL